MFTWEPAGSRPTTQLHTKLHSVKDSKYAMMLERIRALRISHLVELGDRRKITNDKHSKPVAQKSCSQRVKVKITKPRKAPTQNVP